MATIIKRKKSYAVVYSYNEGDEKRQKWESFSTLAEAKKRKSEVEYKQGVGSFVVPKCNTLNDLLDEYISLYGKTKWALSTYSSNTAVIDNYVRPKLGNMALSKITTRVIERYYQELLKTKAVPTNAKKQIDRYLTPTRVREIHKLLRSCFSQAVKWEMVEKNPCERADVPKATYAKRHIWTAETIHYALSVCEDELLALAINLSFSCSLRMGELLGLTWDCVDIDQESIDAGKASISIVKELQRANRESMQSLNNKDIMFEFPAVSSQTKTVLVLKTPKTESSVRKVFLPKTAAEMLICWKKAQVEKKEMLGTEYKDYGLVFAGPFGAPTEGTSINAAFSRLIKEHDLPPVVFHSFRHSSITYKLKLTGGDVKAVQGDSGHAQAKMVSDVYSHILDDDRKTNAQLFEDAFYSNAGFQKKPLQDDATEPSVSQELLLKLLSNPEMAGVLKTLAKGMNIE